VWPNNIKKSKRTLVAELLTRINYGLKIGNFEIDLDDGEVRYKTSIMLEDESWTREIIRPVVFYNLSMMDQYWVALQSVVEGRYAPDKALELVESEDTN